jgi:glycosyltransferase involved in cell wall biosynthesis
MTALDLSPGTLAVAEPQAHGRRQLRIGLLIHSLLPGGAERVCSLLANQWVKQGYQVTLMTFAPISMDAYTLAPGVQRVHIGQWQNSPNRWHSFCKNIARVWRVRQQLRRSRLDVALSFMSVSNSCLAMAGLATRVACIGSERTYPPAVPLGKVGELSRWFMYGLLDAVVAQTEDAARWVLAHTRARVVAAVANPVCLPLSQQEPYLAPQAVVRPGAKLLLAVGRFSEEKRFDALIRAFAAAVQKVQSQSSITWQLVLVGDGELREPLETLVSQLGVKDQVLLPGRAGNIADWYAAADAFALSSRFEGYPNALLEALACGVPAVACDVLTGPRELIEDGVNGLLVANSPDALTSGLQQIMGNAPLRQHLASHADLTIRRHDIARIAARWEEIFRGALTAKGQT